MHTTDPDEAVRAIDAWEALFTAHPELLTSDLTAGEMLARYWAWFPDIVASARVQALAIVAMRKAAERVGRLAQAAATATEHITRFAQRWQAR